MTRPNLASAASGLVRLVAIMAALIFIPARSLAYWQAWLFLAVFLGCAGVVTGYLLRYDPRCMSGDSAGS